MLGLRGMSTVFQEPQPLLHAHPRGGSPTQPSWSSPVMRNHPRGPAKPGVHGGNDKPRGNQVQAMGPSHFHLRKRNVPGNRERGKAWPGFLSHSQPAMGHRVAPTDQLPPKGYKRCQGPASSNSCAHSTEKNHSPQSRKPNTPFFYCY